MAKKVVILGGGVAGMSAAQELAERGFEVAVYERKSIPGGKARSLLARGTDGPDTDSAERLPANANRRWLPGEHGFRFFPRFYKHVVDTMTRIPFRGGCVADNLVDTTEVQVARFDRAPLYMPARFPQAPQDLRAALFTFISLVSGDLGLPLDETAFFAGKMWQLLTSCEERRYEEYEKIGWWEFVGAENKSEGYQKFFGNGITRSLVAAKAQRASTKTIGDIFLQIAFDIAEPGVSADQLLNGPTNDVWITPWLAHLRALGVDYNLDCEVRGVTCSDGFVKSATIARGGSTFEVEADMFIAAVPIERMVELLSTDLLALDPSLANLRELSSYVEWMNGIQFYLTEDVPIAHGHTIYVDSPWALTSVSQPQFWRGYDISKYADGRVRGILSVDISDWDVPGLNGKCAEKCTRDEIAAEVWAQLKRSLNVEGRQVLRDDHLVSWFLDPAIEDSDPGSPGIERNLEPLLVNYTDTWRLRPEAVTRVPNLFLAADYVRTYTDLATMEAANEAARRAVNGVIRYSRSAVAPCELWNLNEPEPFLPWRAYDRVRFRQGLPWDGTALELANAAATYAHSGLGR